MFRQFHRCALLVALALLLLAPAVRAAGGERQGGRAALQVNGVGLDLERVVQAPEALQQATLQALQADVSGALRRDHYTATVLESRGDWVHLLLAPTEVLDSNWQLPLEPHDTIDVIARLDENGAWQAVVQSEATLPWLQREVPPEFMAFRVAAPEEAFLFPWTAGQVWRVSQTWHSGAIDFFPLVYNNPPVSGAVLAMGSGALSQVCNDGVQAHLRINHGGLTSGYLHVDAATVRAHDLNQQVPRGRFLGLIYDGEAHFEPNAYCRGNYNYKYSTPCGCGTGAHVHFSSSNTDISIDGHNLHAVGSSRNSYLSSNVRDEGPPPPTPQVITVVDAPALTPAYSPQCGSGWVQISGYNRANGYVTLNTNQSAQSTNRGEWMPNLPQSGRYQVAAYIPNHEPIFWGCGSVQRTIPGDTTDARYQITHSGGVSTVAANQLPVADSWLPLGTFQFAPGVAGRVRLTDLNGEANLSRTVSFSAMRFVLQPPGSVTELTASQGTFMDRVQLSWQAAVGAASYEIYRALPGAPAMKIGASNSPSYADSSATPGVTYSYAVRALNPAGQGPLSATTPGARHSALLSFLPVVGR